MMRALVFMSCAACNSLLGLDTTQERPADAAADAMPDAPRFPCDLSIGYATPGRAVTGCVDYTTDSNGQVIAVASCGGKISQGVPGSASLTPVTFDDPLGATLDTARLLPSGDQMVVRSLTPANQSHPVGFRVFQRDASNVWSPLYEIQFADLLNASLLTTDMVSAPTAGTSGRRILLFHAGEFREYAEDSDPALPWTLKNVYQASDFNLAEMADPYLSPDGLGLVFVNNPTLAGSVRLEYIVRGDIREAFVRPSQLEMWLLSDEESPFLTADCTKLFVSQKGDTWSSHPN